MPAPLARRQGSTVVSLLVLVAIGAMFIAILLPSLNRARETANRVKCANNLRRLGIAMNLYENENRGAYPRTQYKPADVLIPDVTNAGFDAPKSFGPDSKVPPNCIPASYFLLVKTEDIGAEVFICPSTTGVADDYGGAPNTAMQRSNFTDLARNLSYSFANPFPDNTAALSGYKLNSALDPGFATASDKNPGFSDGSNAVQVGNQNTVALTRMGNSHNHARDGQNILFADGHVDFDNETAVGLDQDNIFCRGPGGATATKDDLVNSPKDKNDDVLLPADSD